MTQDPGSPGLWSWEPSGQCPLTQSRGPWWWPLPFLLRSTWGRGSGGREPEGVPGPGRAGALCGQAVSSAHPAAPSAAPWPGPPVLSSGPGSSLPRAFLAKRSLRPLLPSVSRLLLKVPGQPLTQLPRPLDGPQAHEPSSQCQEPGGWRSFSGQEGPGTCLRVAGSSAGSGPGPGFWGTPAPHATPLRWPRARRAMSRLGCCPPPSGLSFHLGSRVYGLPPTRLARWMPHLTVPQAGLPRTVPGFPLSMPGVRLHRRKAP